MTFERWFLFAVLVVAITCNVVAVKGIMFKEKIKLDMDRHALKRDMNYLRFRMDLLEQHMNKGASWVINTNKKIEWE